MKGRTGERGEKIALYHQTPIHWVCAVVFVYLCSPCSTVGCGHSLCYSLSRVVHGFPVPGQRRWQGDAKWLPWVATDVREVSWSQQDRWLERAFPWMGLHSCSSLNAIPSLFPPRLLWPAWDPASCLLSWFASHCWENALWERVTLK